MALARYDSQEDVVEIARVSDPKIPSPALLLVCGS